jgi:nitroreductase
MDFYQAVAARRTVRRFLPQQVAAETFRRVLSAGLNAPCNAHHKSWQFIRLADPAGRRSAVVNGLKARDLIDKEETERLVAGKSQVLQEVYRQALPVQLTMMLQAPELLVVCYQMKPLKEITGLFQLNPLASVWMCIENIMLALAAEGLYGCTYTPYETEDFKRHLGIPAGYEVAAVIPFGYPTDRPAPNPPEPLEARLHTDGWQV